MPRCPTCGHWKRSPQGEKRPAWNAWTTRHDDVLTKLVNDDHHPADIAAMLSERFHVPRTDLAVRRRIKHLGLSRREGWYSRTDLIAMLGLHQRKLEALEQAGAIEPTRYGAWRRYPTATVEQLVREHAGSLIDPRRVRDPKLKALAETSAIVNRRRAVG